MHNVHCICLQKNCFLQHEKSLILSNNTFKINTFIYFECMYTHSLLAMAVKVLIDLSGIGKRWLSVFLKMAVTIYRNLQSSLLNVRQMWQNFWQHVLPVVQNWPNAWNFIVRNWHVRIFNQFPSDTPHIATFRKIASRSIIYDFYI